jgi:hypothetical protein
MAGKFYETMFLFFCGWKMRLRDDYSVFLIVFFRCIFLL